MLFFPNVHIKLLDVISNISLFLYLEEFHVYRDSEFWRYFEIFRKYLEIIR